MKRFTRLIPKLLITLALALGIYGLIYWVRVPCFFKSLTGLPCPACGLTRAWLAILRGQVARAFAMHPMFWGVPVLHIYFLTDGKLFSKRVDRWILALILVGFAAVFVGRLLVPAWRV